MSERIQSKDNSKIKEAFKAKDGKGESFLVEGFHLVEMALSAHEVRAIFTLKDYPSSIPPISLPRKSSRSFAAPFRPKASWLCAPKSLQKPLQTPGFCI